MMESIKITDFIVAVTKFFCSHFRYSLYGEPMNSRQCRAARALLKWSQTELAGASGVSLSTVADYEIDKREPRPDNLTAIQSALEKAGVIFEGDDKFVGVKLKVKRGR
jgi:predicted transcriptional regulator